MNATEFGTERSVRVCVCECACEALLMKAPVAALWSTTEKPAALQGSLRRPGKRPAAPFFHQENPADPLFPQEGPSLL